MPVALPLVKSEPYVMCQLRAMSRHVRRGPTGCEPAQELMAEAEAELARVDERMGQEAPAAGPTVRLIYSADSTASCLRTWTHLTLQTRCLRLLPAWSIAKPAASGCNHAPGGEACGTCVTMRAHQVQAHRRSDAAAQPLCVWATPE